MAFTFLRERHHCFQSFNLITDVVMDSSEKKNDDGEAAETKSISSFLSTISVPRAKSTEEEEDDDSGASNFTDAEAGSDGYCFIHYYG